MSLCSHRHLLFFQTSTHVSTETGKRARVGSQPGLGRQPGSTWRRTNSFTHLHDSRINLSHLANPGDPFQDPGRRNNDFLTFFSITRNNVFRHFASSESRIPSKMNSASVHHSDKRFQPGLKLADPGWPKWQPGFIWKHKKVTAGGTLTRVGNQPGFV